MNYLNTYYKSVLAGLFIGIGGTIYLSVDNKIIGALLFSVGLLGICTTNQLLLTGRCSYTINLIDLSIISIGNMIGACWCGVLVMCAKPELVEKAQIMCNNKIKEGWRVIILGFLCNICIYLAVEGYRKYHSLLLIMSVMVFILSGFEHSIANVFYFTIGGEGIKVFTAWTYLAMNILGNLLGGFFIQLFNNVIEGSVKDR